MLVRSASKASSQKFATAAIFPPRGNEWVKKTCAQRETLAIAGFALKQNKFDGIFVGRRKGKDLVYAGNVDHGFDKSSTAELEARQRPLIRKNPALCQEIAHRGVWVEPSLLAEIEYRAKSDQVKCGTRFSKASGRTYDLRTARSTHRDSISRHRRSST
jgi:bifunctional non-homologous end joining protein LigD